MKPLVVVGDTLLDQDLLGRVERLCPDAPVPVVDAVDERERPGGAALAALLAAREGRDVVLVTALSRDEYGERLRELLSGIEIVDAKLAGVTPRKVRVRSDNAALLRVDFCDDRDFGVVPDVATRRLAQAGAVLVADYGRGIATAAAGMLRAVGGPLVWDPHPRGPEPVRNATLVTPSEAEAREFAGRLAGRVTGRLGARPGGRGSGFRDDGHRHGGARSGLADVVAQAEKLRAAWRAQAVAVTRGAAGALLALGDGAPLVLPARAVAATDSCGAGDRFAATAAGMLADGALPTEAAAEAVRAASEFVAAGGVSGVPASDSGTGATPAQVRAAGGVVVATEGCFDLLHAGHVATLEAARSLGDYLVVCLNSDASVRRLKGPGRPVQGERDRARVLRALSCVDDVVIFDADTPAGVLDVIRPDIWAKGGDYLLTRLPEADAIAQWGGQAVVLPYLDGRSTTRIIGEASRA